MKGVAKAMARLPHTFSSKFSKETVTVDEEFDALAARFSALDAAADKLVSSACKAKDALTSLLQHQLLFAETMVQARQFLFLTFLAFASGARL